MAPTDGLMHGRKYVAVIASSLLVHIPDVGYLNSEETQERLKLILKLSRQTKFQRENVTLDFKFSSEFPSLISGHRGQRKKKKKRHK